MSANGDAGLVACLIDRLATRLPHRTGTNGQDLAQDDLISISRSTVVQISTGSLPLVLEPLLSHLEELTASYHSISSHPPHVLLSVRFLLSLAADCCTTHWQSICRRDNGPKASDTDIDHTHSPGVSPTVDPPPLDDVIIARFFDMLRQLLDPLPEGFILPTRMILEDTMPRDSDPGAASMIFAPAQGSGKLVPLAAEFSQMEADIRVIVEYLTASGWPGAFEYFRKALYVLRPAAPQSQSVQAQALSTSEEETHALVFLRLLAFFWVNGQKLGLVLQEICSSFLHFRKPFQNNVSLATSLLITRWIDRFPHEFVELHNLRKRLDGGADTIFDMTQAAIENGRRKAVIYPLQTALLFLIPDVFEVVSNLRQVKSNSMSKKVAFLDALRKSLRNRNEHACYCLVSLLRVARHFHAESDAALVSYAMDVQDEVRDAVFRRFPAGVDAPVFEQDMMTAAFVSIAQLNLDSSVDSLIQACLAPSAPLSFKKAVVQGCYYFAKQKHPKKYEQVFIAAGSFMRRQLEVVATLDPASVQDQSPAQSKSEVNTSTAIAYDVLRFLDASPGLLFDLAFREGDDASDGHIFEWFLLCMTSPDDEILQRACNVARRLFANLSELDRPKALDKSKSSSLKEEFWRRSSAILSTMADQITSTLNNSELARVKNYLEARVLLLTAIQDLAHLEEEISDLPSVASKLEMALLVSLCSSDLETCELVTTCIGYFLRECVILEASSAMAKQTTSLLRNSAVFRELASRDFRLTGLVAFQKRVRNLLRRLQYPTSGILSAWELAFDKWVTLSKEISTAAPDSLESRTLAEWRNFSGFLASLGGICTAAQATLLDEPTVSGLRIRLLACSDVRVREATREILTTEISPPLFQPLFRALESELEILFTGSLAMSESGRDVEVIFAEQTSALLKGLIERLENPTDLSAASSVHLGALTLDFAKFLDSMNDSANVQRVKIKVCHLCEAVTKRKEYLNLRDDVRIRNQLLESIFGWITDPRTTRHDNGPQTRHDEFYRIQRDLDKACLRALADLTLRLPLQPAEGQSDAGTSELKSQMFLSYFTRFLSLLNHEPPEPRRNDIVMTGLPARDEGSSNPELAITILSNLLSANIDVGLKHSLNIGYHESIEIRTAFVKVLYNILVQGTEFSNLSDAAMSEKYEELLDLLARDVPLAAAMGAVCPSSEVDELAISLLTIFEHRGLSFQLLEALIKQEVDNTENESELLRRNCVATKMLSIYAKWKGASYLKATLQKVVERLMLTSNDLDLELDPARVGSPEELQKNALQLRIVAKVFIDDICSSTNNMPASFRRICSIISTAVLPRFQEAKYTAVGAFIFLRFFCPAIVAPEVEGLVTTTPSKEMRRGLLLIAKVIQNLANNVLFGAKEPYMFSLNDFLTQNIYKVTTFLREISDGLSIVCVILRHIDAENIDYDTVLYCYLKIASRLWHRPFGLLIDATCYAGNMEPQDDLFKKLELLAPAELCRSLSRVYVYNMNNAFRKCFRRLLRVSSKSSTNVFNPKNVEYHLIGSLQDLQSHFHLSQLNLPRETISVVTDTRYVFQPITRLSKTKGKIEVIIKVGSQFVQVTTANKAEVFPGFRLYTTVNDIFRLGDIDEAQTSIQTEEDSAFGLRADNGKIIMFFTSPQKADILQSIRGAKTKYGKDSRALKTLDRLIRPQDVPGTLLNLAFTNISSPDSTLRRSSYNLLGALCRAFEFDSTSRLMCTRDLAIPPDPSSFIIAMSEHLARTEPQLTYDFLTEFFVGWDSFSDDQKPLSLGYMAPWLTGLRTFVLVAEPDAEKGRDKISVLFRKLIEVVLADHSQAYIIGQTVWSVISSDEVLLEILLEEIIKMGLTFRLHDENLDTLCSIITAIGSVTLRGKVISRLRKALNRSSLRPTRHLAENAAQRTSVP
ncbi:hypothetical protein jhhlp_006950 [Lomentospora prolificans]|uniref:Ras-GAP domain-containing protein n=1 Tax=Lomentospora prolificans TaxID=41688 RepID=A0A2N3N383_9PEZI|nr:hypothetical protein jhhlp_006950 [Lomentospora prolificans]